MHIFKYLWRKWHFQCVRFSHSPGSVCACGRKTRKNNFVPPRMKWQNIGNCKKKPENKLLCKMKVPEHPNKFPLLTFLFFFSLSLSLSRASLNGVFGIGRQRIKIWPFIVKNKKQCNLVNRFQGLLGLSISVFRQPMMRLASLKGSKIWPFIVKIAVKAVLYWEPFTKRAWVKRSEWNADSLLTHQH